MTPELAVGFAIFAAMGLYVLGAGADFGGGVWDLLASGPTAARQRRLIAHALGPVWEANHVWLVLVLVLLFTCFPMAFAAITTALHIPLTVMLIGIVLRGSAFTFRAYDDPSAAHQRWGRVFAIASVVTPIALGTCVGAVLSERLRVEPGTGRVLTDFVSTWWAPFPIAVGGFALALFAYLAAVYLTLETRDAALRRAFRDRAVVAGLVAGALAFACAALARDGAPGAWRALMGTPASMVFQAAVATLALTALWGLRVERYRLARGVAIAQVAMVIVGWAAAQYPYLVPPDLTLEHAAPRPVIRLVLAALGAGAVLLFPALGYLFYVFKREPLD